MMMMMMMMMYKLRTNTVAVAQPVHNGRSDDDVVEVRDAF